MHRTNYKILGLDYGDRKIGIAISENKLALPYKIISNNTLKFATLRPEKTAIIKPIS